MQAKRLAQNQSTRTGTAAAFGAGGHNKASKERRTEIQQETAEKTRTHGSLEGKDREGWIKERGK